MTATPANPSALAEAAPEVAARTPRVARWVRDMNPVHLFLGPVFQRDMRVLGRRKGTYWIRGLYTLALCAVVSLFFVALVADGRGGGSAASIQQFQQLAPDLATAVAWFQLIAAVLIGPVLTSGAICDERRNRTMSALATSPLGASHILCAGLLSRVVQMTLLLLLSAPLMLAIRAFGGLEADFVLATTAISLSTGILAAALGLWGSVHAKRPAAAAAFALTWIVVLTFTPLILFLLQSAGWITFPFQSTIAHGASAASPMLAILQTTAPSAMPPIATLQPLWLWNTLSNLGIAAVAMVLATLQLRRLMVREAAETPTAGTTVGASPAAAAGRRLNPRAMLAAMRATTVVRVLVLLFGLLLPSVLFLQQVIAEDRPAFWPLAAEGAMVILSVAIILPVRRGSRVVGDQPVLWREVRQTAFGSPKLVLGIALGAVALLALAYSEGAVIEEGFTGAVTGIGSVILFLQIATSSGAGIAGEVHARTWHVLLTTPLSPSQIILGKILGTLRRCWVIPAVMTIHWLIVLLRGHLHPYGLFAVILPLACGAVLLACLGTFLSLRLRRQVPAAIWTVAVAVGAWVAVPATIGLLAAAFGSRFARGDPAGIIFTGAISLNPIPMAIIGVVGSFQTRWNRIFDFELPAGDLGVFGFSVLLLVGCAVLLGASLVFYRAAVARFAEINARTP